MRRKCAGGVRGKKLQVDARDALHVMLGNGRVVLRDVCYGQYAGRVMVRIAAPNGDDAGEHLRA